MDQQSNKFPALPESATDLEQEILALWGAEETFSRSLDATRDGEPFVFFEGPPTANGRPGIHHVLSRTIKDAVARFQTMQGRYVPRIAGWDTHGLPVEIEAERRLGISGKPQIEEVGIDRFNEVCRESVLTYTEEWERFSARIGYWLDYSNPYVTYHREYIESIWWSLKQIAERDLFYRGHKILPYCPRCGTGLSSHEVALGYRDIMDPSFYVTFKLTGEERHILVWTTTPWTLPANVALAVDPDLDYVEVQHEGKSLILAEALVGDLFDPETEVVQRYKGSDLVGKSYERMIDWVPIKGDTSSAWKVVPADFVSADEGTGIVHMAPAYGADDYGIGQQFNLPILQPVTDAGEFPDDYPVVAGQFVKDADAAIVRFLKEKGQVFNFDRKSHSYPHCWRCGSPLLYMARDSWFIRTTELKDKLISNNQQVNWYPPEVGAGRFGEWLENNVDWAISRNRYWGTPLPAWVCDADGDHIEFIGSFEELRGNAPDLAEDFDPHRPFIDEVTWGCAKDGCSGTMHRTPEVIDVWYDSGAMPFAQWHYPFENQEQAERLFPADFICEGVDQTRGWFYSLMAISTLLGRGPAYRNVIVNDLILDAEGQKMSKSKGNVVDPWEAMGQFGADAIRWYLLSSSHPWLPKRFDPAGVREVQRKVFDTLRSTYHFFSLYANLEGWKPGDNDLTDGELPIMDRWLVSRLATMSEKVRTLFAEYNLTHAVRELGDFIVDDLSNWYVRRSRDRFWGSADAVDTRAAFATLHRALVEVSLLMAPVAPFLADWLHRSLTGESAHLARFAGGEAGSALELERGMDAVRTLSTLGRSARDDLGIRVRQPLRMLYAVLPPDLELSAELLEILRDELNVRKVEFLSGAEDLVTFSAKPNFRALGARFGKQTPKIANAVRELSSKQISDFRKGVSLPIEVEGETVTLVADDFEVVQEASGDYAVQSEGSFTVALDPEITPELKAEGVARELVSRIQRLRKESDFHVADRIRLGVAAPDALQSGLEDHREFIMGETLTLKFDLSEKLAADGYTASTEADLDGSQVFIAIARAEGEA